MIEAFLICWNESETIQLTIDHYKHFCDKITFYDNHSDDGTREIIINSGCDIISFGTKGVLEDKAYLDIKNNCWKDSKADWVIVCDCDEIVWHSSIKDVLRDAEGTIFKTIGFDVFSYDMPVHSFLELRHGYYSQNYSKLAIFSPKINAINYAYGCHVAKPKGDIRYCKEKLNLWHFRNIGGPQRLIDRHAIYRPRMSKLNMKFKLGIHYLYDDERRMEEWLEQYDRSHDFENTQ